MTSSAGYGAIRVAVVDDQPLLVSAFAALIDHEPDMHVVGTGVDGDEAVALAEQGGIDVLIMDIRMPRLDGVEATRRITARADRPRVLVLTTFNVDHLVLGAVRAGARGSPRRSRHRQPSGTRAAGRCAAHRAHPGRRRWRTRCLRRP